MPETTHYTYDVSAARDLLLKDRRLRRGVHFLNEGSSRSEATRKLIAEAVALLAEYGWVISETEAGASIYQREGDGGVVLILSTTGRVLLKKVVDQWGNLGDVPDNLAGLLFFDPPSKLWLGPEKTEAEVALTGPGRTSAVEVLVAAILNAMPAP